MALQQKTIKKVCLLGGSNSVLNEGLKKGLCRERDLNLALGASTSLQNLYSLASNDISACDVIISESNVNDIHTLVILGNQEKQCYHIDLIKENISNLYGEMHRLNKVAVIIIMPIIMPAQQTIIDDINNHHRALAEKYGFYLVDLDHHFRDYSASDSDTKKIIPDLGHPISGFMCLLGQNLRSFLEGLDTPAASPLFESQFVAVKLEGDCEKSDGLYQRVLRKINGAGLELDIGDAQLIGIETWGDDQSELHIRSDEKLIVKQFKRNLSFNEILGDVTGKISLSSNVGKSPGTTEVSIGALHKAELHHSVMVSGLLLKKLPEENAKQIGLREKQAKRGRQAKGRKQVKPQVKSLSAVIPNENTFISSVTHFITRNPTFNRDIDSIRDIAIELEKVDLQLSLKLMKVVHGLRPDGPLPVVKIRQYESQLNALKNAVEKGLAEK